MDKGEKNSRAEDKWTDKGGISEVELVRLDAWLGNMYVCEVGCIRGKGQSRMSGRNFVWINGWKMIPFINEGKQGEKQV